MNIKEKSVVILEDTLTQKLGDKLVVMNLSTEHFYELDETGKRFWELLAEHHEVDKVIRLLMQEYEVSEELLQEDMTRLIEDLVKNKLINVS
ncbi:hypothetical protein GCM10027037_05680 [Mucilaginibacter koreensis]